MRLEFPDSSNVRCAELLEGGVLEVTFTSGDIYRYGNVHLAQMRAWRDAQSAGSWFHRQIKSRGKDHPVVGKGPRPQDSIATAQQDSIVPAQVAETPPVVAAIKSPTFSKCNHFLCPPDGCAYDEHGRLRPATSVIEARRERARAAGLLAHEDIAALPEGTAVEIIWGGGNGPHTYTVHHVEGMAVCVIEYPSIARDQELEELALWQRGERAINHHVRIYLAERDLYHPGGPPALMDIWVKLPEASWPHRYRDDLGDKVSCPACSDDRPVPCQQRKKSIESLLQTWSERATADVATLTIGATDRGNVMALTPPSASRIELVERGPERPLIITPPEPQLEALSDEDLLALVAGGEDASKAIAELLRQADSEACTRDLREFYRTFWPEIEPSGRPYVENMATDAVLHHLQAVGDGQIRLLGIACPPGIGKSSAASVAFPAWMWARDAAWRAICASHAFDLARIIGLKFLNVVSSDRYRHMFPHVRLASDAVKALMTEASGARFAVGVDGALTGIRANCGIIDDSLNANDAGRRDAVRKANDWYDQAFNNRFDDTPARPAAIVVIQQRLDSLDLIEHVRQHGAEILELPARYEVGRRCVTSIWEDTRTEEGQILAPEIHSEQYLDDRLRVLRPHGFATQYQQRPTAREGNQFKVGMWNWATYRADADRASPNRPKGARQNPPHVLRRRPDGSLNLDWLCVSVDPTGGSLEEDASNLGLAIIGGLASMVFVLRDLTPGPRTFNQQVRDMVNAVILAGAIAGRQPRFTCLVEKKALGVGSMEKIEAAIKYGQYTDETGVPGPKLNYPDGTRIVCSVKPYEPSGKGDKGQRADHLEPDMDAGLIYVMEDEDWVTAPLGWIDEFGGFPRGKDDRVDVLSQAVEHHRQAPALPTQQQWMHAINALAGIRR